MWFAHQILCFLDVYCGVSQYFSDEQWCSPDKCMAEELLKRFWFRFSCSADSHCTIPIHWCILIVLSSMVLLMLCNSVHAVWLY